MPCSRAWPASPSAACSIIASEITCTSVASPFCRRSGDAAWAKLTDDVERRARAMGVSRVRLGVRTALPRLRAYYERCGYRVVREARHAGYETPT